VQQAIAAQPDVSQIKGRRLSSATHGEHCLLSFVYLFYVLFPVF
jgi:hypothetical protein